MADPFVQGFLTVGIVLVVLRACDSPLGRTLGGIVLVVVLAREVAGLLGLL